jgi:hypothetical protein
MVNSLRNAAAAALLLAAWGCEVTKVTSPEIQTITLSASVTSVPVGSDLTIQASLVDSQGRPLDRPINWVADGPQVTVSGTGLVATVRGVSVGTASVRAESEGVVSQSVTISVQNVPATVTSLSSASATVGGAAFTLTVTGRDFANGATVVWNGADRATTRVSATQVTAAILASDLATAGTIQVGVRNPAPGGGSANTVGFTVNNPTPVITSVSPSAVAVGSGAFTLTVTGTSFVNGATVRWNGSARSTQFVNATTLQASILATDVAAAGTGAVTVSNPPPVAAPSNTVNVTVQAAAADLAITNLTTTTSSTVGGTLQVSMTVVNQGTAAAGAFRVAFYLSTDATITTSDVSTGQGCNYPSGLPSGGSNTCTGPVSIPSTVAPGTYFLGAIADDLGVVSETNENNNTRSAGPVTIAPTPDVDLTVTALTAPANIMVGATFPVSMTVVNQGTAPAGAFRVAFYFSTDATITTADEGIALCDYPAGLAGGATHVCNTTLHVPNTQPPGTYFLGAIADDQGVIAERNETNNTRATGAITIAPAPVDLTVTSFIVSSTNGVLGGTLPFSVTVANSGSAAAGSFRLGFYYSTDAVVTTADTFSGTICDYPNGLAEERSDTCSGQLRVPTTLAPGTYFVGAIADDLGRITEINENNNTRVSQAIMITASLEELAMRADLEVFEELAKSIGRRVGRYSNVRVDPIQRVMTGF